MRQNWTQGIPGHAVPVDKAVFNVPGAAESVVTNAPSFNQLVQGDDGVGGVIRVKNGGSLTTGNTWTAGGYNRSAHMIVQTPEARLVVVSLPEIGQMPATA